MHPIGKLLQIQSDVGDNSRDNLMSLIAYITADTIDLEIVFLPSRSGGTLNTEDTTRLDIIAL